MGNIESGYTIRKNDNGVVIKIFGEVPLGKALKQVGQVVTSDPVLKEGVLIENLRKSIIDSSTRISAILESGGVISTDGKIASALLNESQLYPKLPAKLVRFHPDLLNHLRVDWRQVLGSQPTPFFYQEGRNGARLLFQDEFGAMVKLVDVAYEANGNPYPRINSHSVVNQILLSSIKVRAQQRSEGKPQ